MLAAASGFQGLETEGKPTCRPFQVIGIGDPLLIETANLLDV